MDIKGPTNFICYKCNSEENGLMGKLLSICFWPNSVKSGPVREEFNYTFAIREFKQQPRLCLERSKNSLIFIFFIGFESRSGNGSKCLTFPLSGREIVTQP